MEQTQVRRTYVVQVVAHSKGKKVCVYVNPVKPLIPKQTMTHDA